MTALINAQKRAVVVGSGPNGLTAAIYLARAGVNVTVYERSPTAGGGVRTAELTAPGFRHDVCSAIHPMALASKAWRDLDLQRYGLQWVHPDVPLAHPLDDEPAVLLHRDIEETAAGLGEDGPRYLRAFRTLADAFITLNDDAAGPLGIPSHPFLMARFGLLGFRSTTSLARRFKTARAKALLAGLAGHSVLPMSMRPSAAVGLMLGLAGHKVGWPFPKGGAQSLTDALIAHLTSLGGRIETDRGIDALTDLPTDALVFFDTAPQVMARVCGDALPSGYRSKLQRYKMGPGVCKVDYALSAPIPWRDPDVARAGTVHLGGTLEEIEASERAAFFGEVHPRPYVLLAQQSHFDDSRSPTGAHTGWAYAHVPNGCADDVSAAIDAQIERYAPGFKDVVTHRHVMTAADYAAYNENYIGGDIVGGANIVRQLFTRPVARVSPYTTPNPRVFICSASTPPGGGVHGMCGYFAVKAAGFRV